MCHHIHGSDAEHCPIHVITIKHMVHIMIFFLFIIKFFKIYFTINLEKLLLREN